MTPIVANIYDSTRIAMASDTKVTWDPGGRAARPGTEELAKIVILRPTLAVGVTGVDPHGRIRDIVSMRDDTVEDLVTMLEDDSHAGFVVAALDPPRLLRVAGGTTEDLTAIGRAWDGDDTANNHYQGRFLSEWENVDVTIPFRQMTAMQALTTWNSVPTVGGHTVRVDGGPEGFHFLPDYQINVGTGETTVFFAGTGATPGAFGLFYAHRGVGGLFRHEEPDEAVEILASSTAEFIRLARTQHRQDVTAA